MTNGDGLFNVTENHLNTGLRGIPVGTCRTSFVTPMDGVHYCGYPISELANFSPEDIVYLLFNKELPNAEQSAAFARILQISLASFRPPSPVPALAFPALTIRYLVET